MTNSRFQYKAELAQIMNVNVQIGSSYKLERMSKTYTYQNKEIKTKKGTIKISENHKDGEQLPTQFIAYLRVSSDKQDVRQQKNAIENMVRNTVKEIKDNSALLNKLEGYEISPKEFSTITVNVFEISILNSLKCAFNVAML